VAGTARDRYEFNEAKEVRSMRTPVAIVGGGIAALRCARRLEARGVEVVVLDKARAPGGRMATRRTEDGAFDHGAQYFTARDPRFVAQVRRWRQEGIVDEWTGRIVSLSAGRVTPTRGATRRFVGVPRMSAVTRRLAEGLRFEPGFRVAALRRTAEGWVPEAEDGRRTAAFGSVVLALPAPQAVPLLDPVAPALAARAATVSYAPCAALMVRWADPLDVPFDGAFVEGEALSWVARDSSKPGRDAARECWTLHGSPEWSEHQREASPDDVTAAMLDALHRAAGTSLPAPESAVLHHWRYALPDEPLAEPCLFDSAQGLGACGDWCAGPRVEGAFLSGDAMAERLLDS
jgi:predicted NAD/FAD-dependent oxidoreductase